MKKLMYLAITFFTFIFSFIAPIKNNFNININNNKIVEKLDPKKAFENAPTKTNSLPNLNSNFKLYVNISTSQELYNFIDSIDIENDNIYYIGQFEETIIFEETNFYGAYLMSNENSFMLGLITDFLGELMPASIMQLRIENNNVYDYITNAPVLVDNEYIAEIISYYNEIVSNPMNSIENLTIADSITYSVNAELDSNYIYGYGGVMPSAVPGLIGVISSIATGLLSLLISLFSSVVDIFWNVSNNTPTFLGVIILFVVAVPITYWVINFVIGLIRKIRLTRGK